MRKTLVEKIRGMNDPELEPFAVKLDEATNGYYSEPQTHTVREMLGAWARARKAYEAKGGEQLI